MVNHLKLSVIIPTYNKDSEVFKAVSLVVDQLKKLVWDWEIIIVNDASRDFTLKEAIKSKKFNGNTERIKVFSYNLNQGKGFALYHGFKQSRGDVVVFVDSDLDLPATNIPTILDYFEESDADIAIGSKRHPDSKVTYPAFRRFQSKTYQILIHLLFNLNVTDTQVGLKAFRRQALEEIFPRIVVKNFAFDLELLVVAKSLGFKNIVEVPITLNYQFTSTIKISAVQRILMDTFAIYWRKYALSYYQTPHYRLEQDGTAITPQETLA